MGPLGNCQLHQVQCTYSVHAGPGEYYCFSLNFNHPQLRPNILIMERDPDGFDLNLNLSVDKLQSPGPAQAHRGTRAELLEKPPPG